MKRNLTLEAMTWPQAKAAGYGLSEWRAAMRVKLSHRAPAKCGRMFNDQQWEYYSQFDTGMGTRRDW